MKCRAKKSLAKEEVERFQTGGGHFVTDIDEQLIKLLENRTEPLQNKYDSDAGYHDASSKIRLFFLNLG